MKRIELEICIDEEEEELLEREVECMNKMLEALHLTPDWTLEKELLSGIREHIHTVRVRWAKENEPMETAIPMSSKQKTTGAL